MNTEEEPFIREVTGAPEFRCVLGFDWQLEEIVNFFTDPYEFSIFTADPTFNLCRLNLTVTTYRHQRVVTRNKNHHPIMIGPLLIGQTKSADAYNAFFGKLASLSPAIRHVLAFGTDGEEPLVNGLKAQMQFAVHLRCFGHFRDNCKTKLQTLNIPEHEQQEFLSDVFGKRQGEVYEKVNFRICLL